MTTLSRPDAGEARVAGADVVRQPDRVRKAIGVVGQRSGVDPQATGRENLELQGEVQGLRGRERRRRAEDLLERLDLTEAASRPARTWSGGMQRRLDVAMGLVHRPEVLFLDEPTTGLDPEVRGLMWDEIARLVREEGLTVLLTTHYLEEADRLAARLAIVDRGRVVAQGSPEALKRTLSGDTIQVELERAGRNGDICATLSRVAGMRDVVVEGRALRARAEHGPNAVPVLLAALEGEGARVTSVTVARPSLDDVYLRATGRAFAAAHGEDGR